ncbi:MAG: ABC transporter permease [Nakamurella sp.]
MPFTVWRTLVLRIVLAGPLRSLLCIALTAVPLALAIGSVTALNSTVGTAAQNSQTRTGGHDLSISIGERAVPRDISAKLGSGAQLATTKLDIHGVPVAAGAKSSGVSFYESDWSVYRTDAIYRLTDGVLPASKGSVALSVAVANSLGVGTGDRVVIGYDTAKPAVVSGVFVPRLGTSRTLLLAAPGTWSSLSLPKLLRGSLFPSTSLLVDAVPGSGSTLDPGAFSPGGGAMTGDVPVADPFYLQQPILVVIPVLVVLVVAVAGGFLLRLRRLQSDFAVLTALGLSPGRIRTLLVVSGTALVVVGAAVGVLLGISIGALLSRGAAAFLDREVLAQAAFSWPATVLLVLVVVGSALACSLAMSRVVISSISSGAAARPNTDAVPVRPAHPTRRRIVQIVGLSATVAAVVLFADGFPGVFVACAALMVFLLASATDLIRLIGRGLARLGVVGLVSGLMANRDRGRSVLVAAVVMAGVCLPIAVTTSGQSAFERLLAVRTPSMPAGQMRINTHGQRLPTGAVTDIAAAAGAPLTARRCVITTGAPGCWSVQTGPDIRGDLVVIHDAAELEAVSTYRPTQSDLKALRAGTVLTLGATTTDKQGRLLINGGSGRHRLVAARRVDNVVPAGLEDVAGAVVLDSSPAIAGLASQTNDYRTTAPASRIGAVQSAAGAHFLLQGDVTVDQLPNSPVHGVNAMLAVGGGVLALITAVGAIAMAMRERRRTVDQLAMLGMTNRQTTLVSALASAVPGLSGSVIGLLAGMFIAWMRLLSTHTPIAIAWSAVGWLSAGFIVLAVTAVVTAPTPRLTRPYSSQ